MTGFGDGRKFTGEHAVVSSEQDFDLTVPATDELTRVAFAERWASLSIEFETFSGDGDEAAATDAHQRIVELGNANPASYKAMLEAQERAMHPDSVY